MSGSPIIDALLKTMQKEFREPTATQERIVPPSFDMGAFMSTLVGVMAQKPKESQPKFVPPPDSAGVGRDLTAFMAGLGDLLETPVRVSRVQPQPVASVIHPPLSKTEPSPPVPAAEVAKPIPACCCCPSVCTSECGSTPVVASTPKKMVSIDVESKIRLAVSLVDLDYATAQRIIDALNISNCEFSRFCTESDAIAFVSVLNPPLNMEAASKNRRLGMILYNAF